MQILIFLLDFVILNKTVPQRIFQIKFMLHCRMFPTKNNFQGRWGKESECRYCSCIESDLHLFSCAGYRDLLEGINFDMFMSLNVTMDELSRGAKSLLKVKERLEVVNN